MSIKLKNSRRGFLLIVGFLFLVIFPPTPFNEVSGENIVVKVRGPGEERLSLRSGFAVRSEYGGDAAHTLRNNAAKALSLTSADFDEDGMPDLVAGYAGSETGVVSLHRGNVDMLFPKQSSENVSPFLPFTPSIEIPVQPDFLGAGDFDGDGHWDLVAASRLGNKLFLLAGDGRGNFPTVTEKSLSGLITGLTTGEINRRDGLADIIVAVRGEKHRTLVFESPNGAFRAEPEVFDLPEEANAFALGQFDEHDEVDLAIGAGGNLIVIQGRDRKLSLDQIRRGQVPAAKFTRQDIGFDIRAIAGLECGSRITDCGLALLDAEGSMHFFKRSAPASGFSQTDTIRLQMNPPRNPLLVPLRVAGNATDAFVVLDRSSKKIQVVTYKPPTENGQDLSQTPLSEVISLDAASEATAVLPMRLNKDGLSDLVIFREGESAPTVLLTAPQAVFTVNSTGGESDANLNDGVCLTEVGTCTFTAARQQANHCPPPGPNPCGRVDEIRFNLSGSEPFTIGWSPVSLNNTVTIDGYTQAGASPNTLLTGNDAVLKIQFTGPAGGVGSAVNLNGANSVVRGLAFNNFCGRTAIAMAGTGGHIAEGNFTGTDTAGTAHVGCNGSQGIQTISANNTIGGTAPQARNLLADTSVGIDFSGGSNNLVQGNYIGTDRTGTQALGGGGTGISVNPGTNNTLGGTVAGARNIISGHTTGTGIRIQGATNLVQANYIGVNAAGNAPLKNGNFGIDVRSSGNTIGGTTPAARNVISASGGVADGGDGIAFLSSGHLVQGNFIGTDATGTIVNPDGIPNNGDEFGNTRDGIRVSNFVSNITVGGTAAGARNIISGSGRYGIALAPNGQGGTGHLVQGNYIGTDVSGTLARGNLNGILGGTSDSTIGGPEPGARNVISGNGALGIETPAFPFNFRVEGNFIGLQADGSSPLGNVQHGVFSSCFANNLPCTIGGTAAGAGNRIAFNGGDGVRVAGSRQGTILGNSIYSNNLLGIELLGSANNNQTAPVLTSASSTGSTTTINGTLTSTANTVFRLEFFANQACDPSGAGEGQSFLGTANAVTNASGVASFAVPVAHSAELGKIVTATSTSPTGNTSEFSVCRQVSPPPGESISGTVIYGTTPSGQGAKFVPGVLLTASGSVLVTHSTNVAGMYQLSGLGSGPYTVTPTKSGDVNGISALDASRVAQHAAGLIVLTPNQIIAGDATNNGTLSALDASRIAQFAAGITNPGIAGQWKFVPVSKTYASVPGPISNENYEAILVGDVTGNWTPPPAAPPVNDSELVGFSDTSHSPFTNLISRNRNGFKSKDALQVDLPGNVMAEAGALLTVPIQIENTTGKGVLAYEFTLDFDPNVLSPARKPATTIGSRSNDWSVSVNSEVPGRITVIAYSTKDLTGAGTLLNLCFTVIGPSTSTTPLKWTRFEINENEVLWEPLGSDLSIAAW